MVASATTGEAMAATGEIVGRVRDDDGTPVEGVVISALGSTTAFDVSDARGRFTLSVPPGPYLLRAHREGYVAVRGTVVDVRPSGRTDSSFTIHREADGHMPVLAGAGMAAPGLPGEEVDSERSETSLAWHLRRLKRSILRDAETSVASTGSNDFSFTDPFEFIGRAVETSARMAGSLLSDISLDGQVDLLTTGAFDSPADLLGVDRTRNVAFFSVGSNVGDHGDWAVRAAMNQGDLDSWIVSGSYRARPNTPHRYHAGMSYSLQRYQGGNAAALAAVPDTARNVGSVFGFDEWTIGRTLTVGLGATYAHYDYLTDPSLFSPTVSATYVVHPAWRLSGLATRQVSAPGAQEFLPPTRASWLPPQRTFSPLTRDGFRTQSVNHYEGGLEHDVAGATLGVRAFRQSVDDQLVTIFGMRAADGAAEDLGHYYVGAAGDASVTGVGVTVSQSLTSHIRGTVDYSLAAARWVGPAPAADAARLRRTVPVALHGPDLERIHDVRTTVEAEVPQTATRVVVLYRINSAFIKAHDAGETRGLDGRFELQVNQALPFMGFLRSHWEMLVAVRNMFYEGTSTASVYDEILVVRPPKRIVGGLTVRF
ncbi:MAG: TonB-dependent receptor [Vicinamibacterales bacterium]